MSLDRLADEARVTGYNGDGEWAVLAFCSKCEKAHTHVIETEVAEVKTDAT